jgi:hypothetical protein
VPSTRRTQAAGMNTPSTIYGAQCVPTVEWIPAFAGMTEGAGISVAPAEAGVHASNQVGKIESQDYGSK